MREVHQANPKAAAEDPTSFGSNGTSVVNACGLGPPKRSSLRSLRTTKSGLAILGDVPWGSHLCLFHETKPDLLDTVVPYFRAGLENNEFCIWAVSSPLDEDEARNALDQGIPSFADHAAGIEIIAGASGISATDSLIRRESPMNGMRSSALHWLKVTRE
jgi:hypothetical protein